MKTRKASARSAATSSTALQKPTGTGALPLWTCSDCRGAVTDPRRVRCDACIAADPGQAPEIEAGVRDARSLLLLKLVIMDDLGLNPDGSRSNRSLRP